MVSEGKDRMMPDKKDMGKCCATCAHYKHDEDSMYDDWYCNNYDSDNFAEYTEPWYGVSCADYEEKD